MQEGLESEGEVLPVWERVIKMTTGSDSTPVGGLDTTTGSDTSRMKKLFIQLKNEPLDQTKLVVG